MKLTPPAQADTKEGVGNIILCLLEPFSSQVALLGFLIGSSNFTHRLRSTSVNDTLL